MKLQLRKPSWTEKRDSIRLELECPVTYRTISAKMGLLKKRSKPLEGMLAKPSLRGLKLLTSEAVPAGTKVEIRVDMARLGFDRTYELHGRVVWSDFSGKSSCFEQGVSLNSSGPDTSCWEKYILSCLQSTDRKWREN